MRAIRGLAEWKPKLRWLIRRMRLLRPSRRPLLRPRRIALRIPSRWRRMVRASLMNGSSLDRDAQASQLSRCAGASVGIVELVEQSQLLFEQERAVERLVGLLDLAELRELVDRLLVGALEQRPAGALDPLARAGVRAVVGVPLVAADLVDRALGEADDVEGVKADLGVRDAVADRLLVAAGHVDRDRPDRAAALAEQLEEPPARSRRCDPGRTTRSRRLRWSTTLVR